MILLKFNVVNVEPILYKNVKVRTKDESYKIYLSNEGGIPMSSRKYYRPDILYYTNIYPRNPDKLIGIFAVTFMAAGATMALAGKTPGEIVVAATISSLIASMIALK